MSQQSLILNKKVPNRTIFMRRSKGSSSPMVSSVTNSTINCKIGNWWILECSSFKNNLGSWLIKKLRQSWKHCKYHQQQHHKSTNRTTRKRGCDIIISRLIDMRRWVLMLFFEGARTIRSETFKVPRNE